MSTTTPEPITLHANDGFALLPNHHRVARFHTFATGTGWHGWMPRAERFKVRLMWHVICPLLTRWKGYLAWSKPNMGEDLPLGVSCDWKHGCQFPSYFFDNPAMPRVAGLFDSVTTPIVAPPASRHAVMAAYRHAPLQWFAEHPTP